MTIFERHIWACDRLMLCQAAHDACEVHEIGFWVKAELYWKAVIDYLEELI